MAKRKLSPLAQLQRALEAGNIDRQTYDVLAAAMQTQLSGGAVAVARDNSGPINTGIQINTTRVGRDFIQIVTQGAARGEDPEEAKEAIALYLRALVNELAGLRLGAIDASVADARKEPLQLTDVYVPLNTTLAIPKAATLAQWLSDDRIGMQAILGNARETRPVSALDALAIHPELRLLGKPGSGKSTFGAAMLLALAQTWLGDSNRIAELGAGWKYGALLPIRVVLRQFAKSLPANKKPTQAGDLWKFIASDLESSGYNLHPGTMDYVKRIARTSGALFLFDGLDECGGAATRVLAGVNDLMHKAGKQCRFLLTARPYAWPDGPDPARGVYLLADLDDGQIERFIRAWYDALSKRGWCSPGNAESKMKDLLAARHRPELLPLEQNPLLLTLMAILHNNHKQLPEDRADLYGEAVTLLLQRWNEPVGADQALRDAVGIPDLKLSDLRAVLAELAFKLHNENVGREGTADIGADRLARAFRPLLNNSKDKADLVVDYIEKRAGLLVGQGEKDGERQFTFPHRTFQEFLAASHLSASHDFPEQCGKLARGAAGHWQVVLPLAARLAQAERGASAADELIEGKSIADLRNQRRPDATDWSCALLAGMQLQEIGLNAINMRPRTRTIAARVASWLAASLPVHPSDGGASARQRAQAGDVLAAVGDPRFDPKHFHLPAKPDLGFVRIATDRQFKIGTCQQDARRVRKATGYAPPDYEINDVVTPTPEFYISRYLVTVAQFRAFAQATGNSPGEADALRDPDNRPVRWVSWHEAKAYCDWLNEMFRITPELENSEIARLVRDLGWRVDLPSELEWEKAARGGLSGKIFSWGDEPDPERANYDATKIATTSVVGCFPANGYGLHDTIGNLWEWTRSLWGKEGQKPEFVYPYDSKDGDREDHRAGDDVHRVVRGGSWYDDRFDARCAFRYWLHPVDRYYVLGFRVVLRSPPVS